MLSQLLPALRITLALTVLTGVAYPAIVTLLSQLLFADQSRGSLVERDGKVVGSRLIGQTFTKPEYLQSRPSAAGNGYDASLSSGSNLGPTSQKLADRVKASVAGVRSDNPEYKDAIPADMVTASGSGLDPHISPASAAAQAARIAAARNVSVDAVKRAITEQIEGRDLGFLGEPRVNVLMTNLELDRQFPRKQ